MPGPGPDTNALTARDIALVRKTWQAVVPIAATAADLFYGRLFEVAPGVRPLFPDDMSQQKNKLLTLLGTAVSKLDRLEDIVDDVKAMGVRHIAYGAEPAHDDVGQCLL